MNHKEHEDRKAHKEDKAGATPAPIEATTEHIVRQVIGAGISVHRHLGPGFIENVYERALRIELIHRGLRTEVQKPVEIRYRGELVCHHRLDLVVESVVVVEVKSVRKLLRIHQAQILSYMKASGCRVGLLMNFNVRALVNGLRRFVK